MIMTALAGTLEEVLLHKRTQLLASSDSRQACYH